MTLGTGIFLATVVACVTALFIATKDRWNWKKIILWPLGLAVFAGCALWGYIAYSDSQYRASKAPTVHSSFWGIDLGATPEDVVFKKGKPTKKEDDTWIYAPEHSEAKHQVIFDKGRVAVIVSYGTALYADKLDEVGVFASTASVTNTFGEPGKVALHDEGAHRIYCYPNYQVFFSLKEDTVKALGIYDPATEILSCARPPKDLLQEKPNWKDALKPLPEPKH